MSLCSGTSTGDWDLFLGPLEWARAETGGADRWMLQRRGFSGAARVYSPPCPWDTRYQFSITNSTLKPWDTQYQFSTKTLLSKERNPLSVFNKNSTLKADCPEVADSVEAKACPQKTADVDGLRYSPDDPHYGSGPVHTSLYFRIA